MNKECKIVQDLLPSYIEKLTDTETNQFIEEHLRNCKECQKVLNDMEEKLSANTEDIEKKKVNYLKKYNRELRVLQIIVLVILLAFVASVGRKYIILKDLYNKFYKYENMSNYHIIREEYNSGKMGHNTQKVMTIQETYKSSNNYISTFEISNTDEKRSVMLAYNINGENKVLHYSPNRINDVTDNFEQEFVYKPMSYVTNGDYSPMYMAIFMNLDKVKVKGRTCYLIRNENVERYIDAETGMTVKMIDIDNSIIMDVYYETDSVNDDDIISKLNEYISQ